MTNMKVTPYYSKITICSFLQRKIIIHSILYYEKNKNILSDREFDLMCKELIRLSKETEGYENTQYYYCFYDFDGTTGFDLFHRLKSKDREFLTCLSNHVYKMAARGI